MKGSRSLAAMSTRDRLFRLAGKYVYGDLSRTLGAPGGRLFLGDLATGDIQELIIGTNDRPLGLYLKGFGEDANGELYVLGSTGLGPMVREGRSTGSQSFPSRARWG